MGSDIGEFGQTIDYSACDQTVYQQDVVIHRTTGTAYEETVGGMNIWHLYVGEGCKSDYGDVRFTDSSGTELAYYLWPDYDSARARFCVRLASADLEGQLTARYGNPDATTTSNGDAVYPTFDQFDGTSLNSAKWKSLGGATVSGGQVTITGSGLYGIVSTGASQFPFRVDCRFRGGAVEAYMCIVQTSAGSDTDWLRHGYGGGPRYYYLKRTAGDMGAYQYFDRAMPTVWTDSSVVWTPDSSVYYENGEQVNTVTAQDRWSSGQNYVQVITYWGTVYCDYILVRAYSDVPPAVIAFSGDPTSTAPPVAAFTASPMTGATPMTVTFTGNNPGSSASLLWDFGDGETSTERRPSHTYTEPGTYTVTLTATNAYGSDTATFLIASYVPGPYYVATYADLCKVGTGVDGWTLDEDYIQTADIQCPAGASFTPIGTIDDPFIGSYDGRGYEIRNLFINMPDGLAVGLFGKVEDEAVITNVTLEEFSITAGVAVGGLVGWLFGEGVIIENCTVSGTISGGEEYIGGLIGYAEYATITDCHADVKILGEMVCKVGGLIGDAHDCTVTSCTAQGDITYADQSGGGLIGYGRELTLTDCHATGDVRVDPTAGYIDGPTGGLGGHIQYSSLSNCSATGTVVGGGWAVGGLVGYGYRTNVTRCYATGPVDGQEHVGGLIGYYEPREEYSLDDCYATGNVVSSGSDVAYCSAGGLIGLWDQSRLTSDGYIRNVYSTGSVSAPNLPAEYAGGLIGQIEYDTGVVATAAYWNIETSGQAASAGGAVGKTTAEMKTIATFADWDIATVQNHGSEVWYIADGEDYPGLAWADMPPYDTSVSHYRGARGDKFGSGRYAPEGPETGSLAWTYQTGDPIKNSPVVGPNGNIVFRGASGTVYCISPDGNPVWTHASPGDYYIRGSVGIDNSGNIYFGYWALYDFPDPTSPGDYSPSGGYLCSLASDGSVRWQTDRLSNGSLASQSPVIQNGMVYIVPTSSTLAFNCADGSLVWASEHSGDRGYGASVGKDGTIIVTPAQSNRLMSLGPFAGSLNWQAALTYPIDVTYAYNGTPAISPETGVIYIPGEHFRADEVYERYYVINAIGPDGTRLWETAKDPSSAPSKYASLAVGLLAVYSVWNDGSLRAHDLSTGEQLWSFPGSFYEGARPSPVLDGADTVYIGGTDGYFYAIASDGSEKWKHNIGSEYINSATIGDDRTVYVTTQEGSLYAFPLPDKLPYLIAVRDAHALLMGDLELPIPVAIVNYSGDVFTADETGKARIYVDRNLPDDTMLVVSASAEDYEITTKVVQKAHASDGVIIWLWPVSQYVG